MRKYYKQVVAGGRSLVAYSGTGKVSSDWERITRAEANQIARAENEYIWPIDDDKLAIFNRIEEHFKSIGYGFGLAHYTADYDIVDAAKNYEYDLRMSGRAVILDDFNPNYLT